MRNLIKNIRLKDLIYPSTSTVTLPMLGASFEDTSPVNNNQPQQEEIR